MGQSRYDSGSASRQGPPQLGDRDALDRPGLVRRAHGADLAAGSHVDGGAFDVGAVAGELDDHLAKVGVVAQAATGRRATLQWANSLSIACTTWSIMASVWFGEGVKRRRSVPLGTVG